jgi:uncharacterized membrane protein
MQMTPIIAIHLSAALAAVALGPVALWARRGKTQRPRLHRAFGYAWVTLMLVTAISALFIRDTKYPNIAGYTAIHLLVPVTLAALFGAFWLLARGNIKGHSRVMRALYFFACIVAGAFTLLPHRFLGQLLWGQFPMLLPILRGTPVWAWALLAALVVLGLAQVRNRSASLGRVSGLPVGLTVFSLWAAIAAFGRSPLFPEVLGLWLLGAGTMLALIGAGQSAARYDADTRRYALPGSWIPLALFLGVFLARYVVAVRLALHPGLAFDRGFVLPVAALYGAFSGIFLGRAVQLWRLALRPRLTLAA